MAPRNTTSHPTDINPADTAVLSISADTRVSVAMAAVPGNTTPTALPICMASLMFISWFTTPRTPLVPNILPIQTPLEISMMFMASPHDFPLSAAISIASMSSSTR